MRRIVKEQYDNLTSAEERRKVISARQRPNVVWFVGSCGGDPTLDSKQLT